MNDKLTCPENPTAIATAEQVDVDANEIMRRWIEYKFNPIDPRISDEIIVIWNTLTADAFSFSSYLGTFPLSNEIPPELKPFALCYAILFDLMRKWANQVCIDYQIAGEAANTGVKRVESKFLQKGLLIEYAVWRNTDETKQPIISLTRYGYPGSDNHSISIMNNGDRGGEIIDMGAIELQERGYVRSPSIEIHGMKLNQEEKAEQEELFDDWVEKLSQELKIPEDDNIKLFLNSLAIKINNGIVTLHDLVNYACDYSEVASLINVNRRDVIQIVMDASLNKVERNLFVKSCQINGVRMLLIAVYSTNNDAGTKNVFGLLCRVNDDNTIAFDTSCMFNGSNPKEIIKSNSTIASWIRNIAGQLNQNFRMLEVLYRTCSTRDGRFDGF